MRKDVIFLQLYLIVHSSFICSSQHFIQKTSYFQDLIAVSYFQDSFKNGLHSSQTSSEEDKDS